MDCSTPGFPVHQQLSELAQTYAHWVGDAIQPSHPLLSSSPPAFNLSQHQGLFKWVSSLHQVVKVLVSASASVLPMNIQDWFPLGWTGLISLQSKGLSRVFSREPINTGHTSQLRWEEPRVKRYKVVPGDKLSLSRTLTKLIIHLPCHCLRFL